MAGEAGGRQGLPKVIPITPWWRVLKEGGKLNPKCPGGVEEQAKRLRAEGHELIPGKGKQPPKVADCGRRLASLG